MGWGYQLVECWPRMDKSLSSLSNTRCDGALVYNPSTYHLGGKDNRIRNSRSPLAMQEN